MKARQQFKLGARVRLAKGSREGYIAEYGRYIAEYGPYSMSGYVRLIGVQWDNGDYENCTPGRLKLTGKMDRSIYGPYKPIAKALP